VRESYDAITDTRFKLLGFLPIASGVGIYAVLGDGGASIPPFAWVAGLFGFMVTLGLFFYELRGLQRGAALERSGRDLEAALGLTNGPFSSEPAAHLKGLVNVRTASWVIYSTVLGAWVYLMLVRNLSSVPAAVVGIIVAVGIAFWFRRSSRTDAP
jgi:hypothetical protein